MKYQMRPAMFAIDPRIDRQQRVELMAGKQSRLFIFFNQLHLLQIICYLKWDEPKFPVINGSIFLVQIRAYSHFMESLSNYGLLDQRNVTKPLGPNTKSEKGPLNY